MCNILFVQTGGMIDRNDSVPTFKRFLNERLSPSFQYELASVFQKDGKEITDEDREDLLGQIDDLLQLAADEGNEYDGVIITHGTDSMIETARFLGTTQFEEGTAPRIIITGAMRPGRVANSDADGNLGMAIAAVQTTPPGFVGICMHGLVLSHDMIDWDHSTGKLCHMGSVRKGQNRISQLEKYTKDPTKGTSARAALQSKEGLSYRSRYCRVGSKRKFVDASVMRL